MKVLLRTWLIVFGPVSWKHGRFVPQLEGYEQRNIGCHAAPSGVVKQPRIGNQEMVLIAACTSPQETNRVAICTYDGFALKIYG